MDPSIHDCLEDWQTAYALRESGQLDQYRGQHIAILQGKVIGFGNDPERLNEELSKQHQVARNRIAIMFMDDRECLLGE